MRALWRHCMAPLVMAGAVLLAGGSAHAAALATHPGGSAVMAACPAGTHWDNGLHHCV